MDNTIKLTGLWKQKTKAGETFLSGSINPISSILVMPNSYKKEGDTAPDYFLYFKQNEKKEAKETASKTSDL